MKVAIWGSYNYGNYGDDVMALQFAEHLKRLGVTPCVYRLNKSLAQQYSVESTHSVTELLNGASFCIIGGGGMLVGEKANNHASINSASTTLKEFEKDFRELLVASTDKNCSVYPISVGGDGRGASTPLPEWRYKFWRESCCKESTVRLVEDIALVNKLGKKAVYYPDVLWSVGEFWKIQSSSLVKNQLHVGINLPDSRTNHLLALQLDKLSKLKNNNIVFHFVRTYLPDSPIDHDLVPKITSPNIKCHVYTDPVSTLRFLSSLDLVVSHKLHLGLTSLALGVPFYSFGGQGKTQTLLKSINAEFAILPFDKNHLIKMYETLKLGFWLSNLRNIQTAQSKFDFAAIDSLKKLSWGHLNQLQQLVSQYS